MDICKGLGVFDLGPQEKFIPSKTEVRRHLELQEKTVDVDENEIVYLDLCFYL